MKREAVATGDTIQIAFQNACEILQVEEDQAGFEVLEEPVKKTFGLFGGSPAKVRAYLLEKTPVEKAAEYLEQILPKMGVADVRVEIVREDIEDSLIRLSGNDSSIMIGHRGETLDALQCLASLVANNHQENYHRIMLDVGNFREKRKEALENLAEKIAQKAMKTGKCHALEPMNSYERRIIHTVIQDIDGVVSWSDGQMRSRHIVVGPEDHPWAKKALLEKQDKSE